MVCCVGSVKYFDFENNFIFAKPAFVNSTISDMSCEKTSSFFNCEESPKITSEKSATVYPSTPLFSKVKIHILTRKSVVYMYVV